MTTVDAATTSAKAKAHVGLRANSFAAIVKLLLESGLGIGVNLYTQVPARDLGKGLLPAFWAAVTQGPVVLALHAILGTLLLLTGISALVRSGLLREAAPIAITAVSLLAILVAWVSGAHFVEFMETGAVLVMAIATGVSVLCYALILLIVPGQSHDKVA